MSTDERAPLRRISPVLLLPMILFVLVVGSCERNHYRRHDYHFIEAATPEGVGVRVSMGGTEWIDVDSAGMRLTQWTGPYRVWVSSRPPSGTVVEVLEVRLVGVESGRVVEATFSDPHMSVSDSVRPFRTDDLEVPYEDYQVHVRLRTTQGGETSVATITGVLRKKFQAEDSFAFWDRLMSV